MKLRSSVAQAVGPDQLMAGKRVTGDQRKMGQ